MTDTTDTTTNTTDTTPTTFQPGDNIYGATINIYGAVWHDRINGTSYCSSRVYINGDLVLYVPFENGYGDYYRQAAMEALVTAGYLTTDDGTTHIGWQHKGRYGYTAYASVDMSIRLKRDVEAWGKAPR